MSLTQQLSEILDQYYDSQKNLKIFKKRKLIFLIMER